jgi:O-antigen/teichoic acid export membrane protein
MALRLLALSAVPNLMTTTVVAISRARRRLAVVVGVLAGLAIMVLGLTELLVPAWGITGAAAAWLIAQCVTASVLLWRRSWWMPKRLGEPLAVAASQDGR